MMQSAQREGCQWSGFWFAVLLGTPLLLVAGQSLVHGVPRLVRELNAEPQRGDSNPLYFTEHDGLVYFNAEHRDYGTEAWKTDGTEAGTLLVRDLNPGSQSSDPYGFLSLGPAVLFSARTDSTGRELFRSDGTEAGTALLKDLEPGPDAGHPQSLTLFGTEAYFGAQTSAEGHALWRTDGTPVGTVPVITIEPDPRTWTGPNELTALGDVLVFGAGTRSTGWELWRSDGTGAGTFLVADIEPGPGSSQLWGITRMGGEVFFQASRGAEGAEPWASDGTPTGTRLVRDINPGANGSYPEEFTPVGSWIYFSAEDDTAGRELWRSDGTAAGTSMVVDLQPGPESSWPYSLTAFGDLVCFIADDSNGVSNLWCSDGTPAGTIPLNDMWPYSLVVHAGRLYFESWDRDGTGKELWSTDGTPAGTSIVVDAIPGPEGPGMTQPRSAGGRLYYTGSSVPEGRELWSSDGTAAGTGRVTNLNPERPWSWIRNGIANSGSLYFSGPAETGGDQALWKSDGKTGGTLVLDTGGSQQAVSPFGDAILYSMDEVLYHTEGTPGDIDRLTWGDVRSVGANIIQGSIPVPVVSGDLAFFTARQDDGLELWATDGTRFGTRQVADINPGSSAAYPNAAADLGGMLYFGARDGGTGRHLWRSDGTEAGTVMVSDLPPDAESSISWSRALGDTLFFAGYQQTTGTELWRSDGTGPGTQMILEIFPGEGSGVASTLARLRNRSVVFEDYLYFLGDDGVTGAELWRSDGTAQGTVLVRDIQPGPGGSGIRDLVVAEGALYFSAANAAGGRELWRSDGTEAGTVRVVDLRPGAEGSNVSWIQPLRGTAVVYFSADSGDGAGMELWRSDGTGAGTTRVADLRPGAEPSNPASMVQAGGVILFTADADSRGRQLWALVAASGAVPDGTGSAGAGPPLRLVRTGAGEITLRWSPSCSSHDGDYAVYAGAIGDFASHAPLACSTAGATEYTFESTGAATYYLVAPRADGSEGSLGRASNGAERPRLLETCATVMPGACE